LTLGALSDEEVAELYWDADHPSSDVAESGVRIGELDEEVLAGDLLCEDVVPVELLDLSIDCEGSVTLVCIVEDSVSLTALGTAVATTADPEDACSTEGLSSLVLRLGLDIEMREGEIQIKLAVLDVKTG
jgi:hypothetical protein